MANEAVFDSGGVVVRNKILPGAAVIGAASGSLYADLNGQLRVANAVTASTTTGVTTVIKGQPARGVVKVTIPYTALAAAATTADATILTLPAKWMVTRIVADTTTKFIGGAVTAATIVAGTSAGGNQYIVSHDVFTAAVTKGLADADLGTSINRANAVQGGHTPSWTATTTVQMRITTTTANTNALTQGSVTFYVWVEEAP